MDARSDTDSIDDLGHALEAMEVSVTESAAQLKQEATTTAAEPTSEPNGEELQGEELLPMTLQEDEERTIANMKSSLEKAQVTTNFDSLSEFLTTPTTVRIYVGPDLKMWTINESLLCTRIPYFAHAFRGPFQESISKTMTLPEDDASAFGKLVDWVHSGCLPCTDCTTPKSPEPFGAAHELLWCSLWVLSDKIGCLELAYAALDRLKKCFALRRVRFEGKPVVSRETVRYVWENTVGDKGALRGLLINEVLMFWFSRGVEARERNVKVRELAEGGGEEIMALLLEKVQRHVSRKECWQKKFCWFHGGKCVLGCEEERVKLSRKEKKAAKEEREREAERMERMERRLRAHGW